jgi:hypothetical protein
MVSNEEAGRETTHAPACHLSPSALPLILLR